MDRLRATLLIMLLVASCFLIASTHARKLIQDGGKSSSWDNLFLSALPKGTTPSSSPSKRVHGTALEDHKLFQRHLSSIHRFLQSVPSPGVGH
ncbi:hypothetical protein Nepgr_032324 [Nepenthes gracilis]|uniref:Uncharacterized protein n=1 Tax=Nepenthes gracilis TaxID=150966 RepID=A0AAD3Y874_NEPGR|nr:hypothetical protein Nepgr_032324 [Nepenthes gracilis]